jgi:hypothetical protein
MTLIVPINVNRNSRISLSHANNTNADQSLHCIYLHTFDAQQFEHSKDTIDRSIDDTNMSTNLMDTEPGGEQTQYALYDLSPSP